MTRLIALLLLVGGIVQAGAGRAEAGQGAGPVAAAALPGREADAQVAEAALRLATAGRARCATLEPAFGIVWQHLSQFTLADRAGLAADQSLDRGPEAVAVVPGGPGALAGILPGDILLAVDGIALPPEPGLAEPFDQTRAQARVDLIEDRLAQAGRAPTVLLLARRGAALAVRVTARAACPARVRLARSGQTNAFADSRHVFLTTGLLAVTRNPDERAFVVAHEMAHTILGHAALLRARGVGHGLASGLGRDGAVVRQTERDADRLGGMLMLDAGYDPIAGVKVLERIGGLDLGIALFATHDSAREREAAMRALVAGHVPAAPVSPPPSAAAAPPPRPGRTSTG